jgi:hypothetical protein
MRWGRPVDGDGDGQAGGIRTFDFETLSLTTLPGTTVFGRVFASELAAAENGQPGVFVNRPLPGVRIFVDGLEDRVFTYTDEDGDFRLEDCPVGDFFVYIDGRTVAFASGDRPTVFPDGRSIRSWASSGRDCRNRRRVSARSTCP